MAGSGLTNIVAAAAGEISDDRASIWRAMPNLKMIGKQRPSFTGKTLTFLARIFPGSPCLNQIFVLHSSLSPLGWLYAVTLLSTLLSKYTTMFARESSLFCQVDVN